MLALRLLSVSRRSKQSKWTLFVEWDCGGCQATIRKSNGLAVLRENMFESRKNVRKQENLLETGKYRVYRKWLSQQATLKVAALRGIHFFWTQPAKGCESRRLQPFGLSVPVNHKNVCFIQNFTRKCVFASNRHFISHALSSADINHKLRLT